MDRRVPTTLRIGSRGFTLIEVMVAVAVLSFGIVMLYEAFFTCLNAFNYSSDRLHVQRWMDEKIWETQEELIQSGSLAIGEYDGIFMDKNKNFYWKMSINLIGAKAPEYLYSLSLTVIWKEAQKKVSLSQAAYVQS